MVCTLASLTQEQIRELQSLESEVGTPLLAFSCFQVAPADLDPETLQRIREMERQLGVALLAVNSDG